MSGPDPHLSDRQRAVLRALIAAYLGGGTPVGSSTLSQLLTVRLSSASVRNTLSELSELGLIEKPHASAGRVPTEDGIRHFVDKLLELPELAVYQRRSLDRSFDGVPADDTVRLASQLLSDHTRLLGFVISPRLERLKLRQLSFVRLSNERVLAVLVDSAGSAHQRVIDVCGIWDGACRQVELDRVAAALNELVAGRTLHEALDLLRLRMRSLRHRANRLIDRALMLGMRAAEAAADTPTADDLVIATRLALLEQPEFADPERVRELFGAIEEGERLLALVGELLERGGTVALGDDLDLQGLAGCAVVAAPYGDSAGGLGVIGPARMDYARIIPLVSYCSQLVTDKLGS